MRSIQASPSPSRDHLNDQALTAGPLRIAIEATEGAVLELITATVGLFNVGWRLSPMKTVSLRVEPGPSIAQPSGGSYLECARMLVDTTPDGLKGTTASGASVRGQLLDGTERWTMTVPFVDPTEGQGVDIEDMLSLVLTTGWRRMGWVPVHGGGATSPVEDERRRGVVVCAGSGGGKTTFTVAVARRGWLSVGDDKLLVRTVDGRPMVAAIKHMLNIDPAVSRWFPEAAAVSREPIYSTWTDKRRVSMASLWPHAPTDTMMPTHLFVIERRAGPGGIDASPIALNERISALLRQTVIPRDRAVAAPIVRTMTELANGVQGHVLFVYDDAYESDAPIDGILRLLA